MKKIALVPYDKKWPSSFEQEACSIKRALGENCVAIHHFGSTSIPGLRSKPVIDIMAEVKNISLINVGALEALGFEFRGEVVASGRYLSKRNPRVHLHIFEEGNPLIKKNLRFRDWLCTHPDDREAYAELMKRLAGSPHKDGMSYARAKTDFIDAVLGKIGIDVWGMSEILPKKPVSLPPFHLTDYVNASGLRSMLRRSFFGGKKKPIL